MTTPNDSHPKTLSPSGTPPATRVGSANEARAIFHRLWEADQGRSAKRAMLKGLVDGNPPYRQHDLRAAGRDWQCNINWRVSESYLENSVGSFYDLYHEAPTYATIRLKKGTPEQVDEWSRIATQHFDWLCRLEPALDYDMQVSQGEMVLYGCGPLMFEDIFDWRPTAVLNEKIKVPEYAKSDVSRWEYCTVEADYTADKLWEYILNEKAAKDLGWNVERVKQAIIHASPMTTKGGLYQSWEWHQQQLKNGAINYGASSKTISVVHLFFREFAKKGEAEGKISHVVILRDGESDKPDTFLFQKVGRYEYWCQCIHPMYYDRGGGGYHHSVAGIGVKMYGPMELQNRLLCANADKAFAPKIFFRPTTSTAAEDFSVVQHSDYGITPEGYELMQTPISGVMEEGLVFNREITNLLASNLSAYRTNMAEPLKGNPDTATEVRLNASKEAALQKTQMNRYYAQMDSLYAEMYRRAVAAPSDTVPGGERAREFVERCTKAGVPKEALKEVEYVKATRVVGQGSEFLRQQVLQMLLTTVTPMLPESGRGRLIKDFIGAHAGQAAVDGYYPEKEASALPDDQYAWAVSQVADMKIGVPAVVTDTQNPLVFATTFLQAADQAASTLEQGANPAEVASFLDLAGQAIAQHLQRMAGDPSRKQVVKQLEDQWKKLAKLHDQLVQMVQQQQQEAQEQRAEMQQQMSAMNGEMALAKARQDAELALKAQKTQFGMAEKSARTRQGLAINDAKAASSIRIQQMQAAHKARMENMEMNHRQMMEKESASDEE